MTLKREIEVEVLIDETVVDKSAIKAIHDHFDECICNRPESCEDKLSEYECGLYNYARSAAIVAAGIEDVGYIILNGGHTTAKVENDYLETEFEKIETIWNMSKKESSEREAYRIKCKHYLYGSDGCAFYSQTSNGWHLSIACTGDCRRMKNYDKKMKQ